MQRSLNVSLISHFNGFSAAWWGGNLVTRESVRCMLVRVALCKHLSPPAPADTECWSQSRLPKVKRKLQREREREVLIVLRATGTLFVLITVDSWCFSHLLCWKGPGGGGARGRNHGGHTAGLRGQQHWGQSRSGVGFRFKPHTLMQEDIWDTVCILSQSQT